MEYDPAVTGISLSSTCKEVNVGWSGYISATVYPASALNKTVYWESSDSNVASINPTSGLICAGLAGSTVITATTADGGFKATCTLNVSQVLTYPDTLITNQATKDSIIKMKNFKDETTLAYLKGTISADARDKAYEEFDYQINLARADYIVVGNNPTSNYAYAILGGNPNASVPTSFSRILYLNTSNPMTGLDVMVVQRTLELYGYYDHDADSKYGTWDEYTHNAALSWSPLLSVSDSNRVFDGASFNVLFQSSNISQRTYDAMRLLQQFNLQHKFVQGYCMGQLTLGGTTAAIEIPVKSSGSHGGTGRADLVGTAVGGSYVWEVKHNSSTAIAAGDLQIQRYIAATQTNLDQPAFKPVSPSSPFSLPLIAGPAVFPKTAVPWYNGKFLIFSSYTSANPYRNALIVYEEVTSIPTGYAYAPEPVAVDVPDPVPSYSFSLSGVYDSLTNFGNAVVEGLRIDPQTGEVLVVVFVAGVICIMALGMIAAMA